MKLGVNIDHIAVLREARKINDPDPVQAIGICERAGASQITIHLREDRRHICDEDAKSIIRLSHLPVNLECAVSDDIINFVCEYKPMRATIVPEKREEVTTEGGLAVTGEQSRLKKAIDSFHKAKVEVSLFIDPSFEAISASKSLGAEWIEFHTGHYANIFAMLYSNLSKTHHRIPELDLPRPILKEMLDNEIKNLKECSAYAKELNLKIAAGHGLNYQNVKAVADIEEIEELNIGQSIIARSVFSGLESAIKEMIEIIRN